MRTVDRLRPSLRDHPLLVGVALALPVLEVSIVWATGLHSGLAIAPQITAPEPFGAFHDLRWLLVYHWSWASFVVEASAALAFRTAVVTVMVRAAWPRDDVHPPSLGHTIRHAAGFVVAADLLLAPFAALLFAFAALPVSWLFFAALPGAFVVALLIHHGVAKTRWWRDAPPLRSVGLIALTFVVLTLTGATLSVSPARYRILIALAAGLFNAWAWLHIVRVLAGRPTARIRPVAPIGVTVLIGLAVIGVFLGLAGHRQTSRLRSEPVEPTGGGRPVLVVTGFHSPWSGGPSDYGLGKGFTERRFSYRGLGADARPLPYGRAETQRSLRSLVHEMSRQVDALQAATGRDIDIVAESEGSILAETYVTAAEHPPVHRVVLLSPLVEPARVRYPRPGEEGWGVATGWIVRGVSAGIEAITSTDLSPDSPFARSVIDHAPSLRGLLSCRKSGVSQLALFPLADAVSSPHPSVVEIRDSVVPAFHGGLLGDTTVRHSVALALRHGKLPGLDIWQSTERVVSVMSAAWQAPVLPLTTGWNLHRTPGCAAVRSRIRAWVDLGDG
ncbi:MAG TPA: hypothetical protein VFW97_18390 [Acidimicrobiia bacterium]|nr:hypothetical protein [Acidimicrobiia bacterium]